MQENCFRTNRGVAGIRIPDAPAAVDELRISDAMRRGQQALGHGLRAYRGVKAGAGAPAADTVDAHGLRKFKGARA